MDLAKRAKLLWKSATTAKCVFMRFCKLALFAGGASLAMTGTQTGSCRILSYLCKNWPASRTDKICSMTGDARVLNLTRHMKGQVAPSSALQSLLRHGKHRNADWVQHNDFQLVQRCWGRGGGGEGQRRLGVEVLERAEN